MFKRIVRHDSTRHLPGLATLITQKRRLTPYHQDHSNAFFKRMMDDYLVNESPAVQHHLKEILSHLKSTSPGLKEDTYALLLMMASVTAKNPVKEVTALTMEILNKFKELFSDTDANDKLLGVILTLNKIEECRERAILGSPDTFKAFLNNLEDYNDRPETLHAVLEFLLTSIGKPLLISPELIRAGKIKDPFDNNQEAKDQYHSLLKKLKINEDDKIRLSKIAYIKGEDGAFPGFHHHEVKSHAPDTGTDITHPDGKPVPGSSLPTGVPGIKFRLSFQWLLNKLLQLKNVNNRELIRSFHWLFNASEYGIHLQYGPSGTTPQTLAGLYIFLKGLGKEKIFSESIANEPTFNQLLVHYVMIPFLLSAYHTPAEVKVAAHYFVNCLEGNDIDIESALTYLHSAFEDMINSTKPGAEKEAIECLSRTLKRFNAECKARCSLGMAPSSGSPQPPNIGPALFGWPLETDDAQEEWGSSLQPMSLDERLWKKTCQEIRDNMRTENEKPVWKKIRQEIRDSMRTGEKNPVDEALKGLFPGAKPGA